MFVFEKLRIYQDALLLVDTVYGVTKNWPSDERYGLIDQARRAASSILLNIAEGSSRTKKDFSHFIGIARGSCYESVAIFAIAKRRGYVSESEHRDIYDALNVLARSINSLKKILDK